MSYSSSPSPRKRDFSSSSSSLSPPREMAKNDPLASPKEKASSQEIKMENENLREKSDKNMHKKHREIERRHTGKKDPRKQKILKSKTKLTKSGSRERTKETKIKREHQNLDSSSRASFSISPIIENSVSPSRNEKNSSDDEVNNRSTYEKSRNDEKEEYSHSRKTFWEDIPRNNFRESKSHRSYQSRHNRGSSDEYDVRDREGRSRHYSKGRVRDKRNERDKRRRPSDNSVESRTKSFHTKRLRKDSDYDRYQDNSDRNSDNDQSPELMSYKSFLLRQRDDITPEEAQSLYEQYRKEYQFSTSKVFFERHRDEEWFQEKYCPSIRAKVYERQLKASEKASVQFLNEVRAIVSSDSGDADENSTPDVSKIDREKYNAFLSKYNLNRDRTVYKFIKDLEAEIQIEDEAEKVEEIEKRLFEKRKSGGLSESEKEEASTKNSRDAENGKQKGGSSYFNGDEKKHDDDDELPEELNKNLSALGRSIAKKTQVRSANFEPYCDENSVFVSTLPLKVTRQHLLDVFEKIEGFEKICISEPIPKYNMNRFAWVTFDTQANCLKALDLNGLKINFSDDLPPLYLHLLPKKKSSKCVEPAHFYTLFEKRVSFDIKQALKIIETLNERKMFSEKFDRKLLKLFETKIVKLNLLIAYLRIVHSFCYYCGIDYMTEEGLMSRCTKTHPRNNIVDTRSELNFRFMADYDDYKKDYKAWTRELDNKIREFVETDANNDIFTWAEKKEKEFKESKTEYVSKGRYLCRICSKMFIAAEFIHKHIRNKHLQMIEDFIKDEEERDFFRNYEEDNNRLQLEQVEPVIPGDVSFVYKGQKPFYRAPANPNSYRRPSFNRNEDRDAEFRERPGSRYFPRDETNGRRNLYTDLDKPPGDGEEDIDYGFGSETMSMFHV